MRRSSFEYERPWWKPLADFAGHVFGGSALFLVIAVPAVALSLGVKYLSQIGIAPFTLKVLELLDDSIVVVDATLYMAYLVTTAFKALREMIG